MPDEGQVSVVQKAAYHVTRQRQPVAAPEIQLGGQRFAGASVRRVRQGPGRAPEQKAQTESGVNVSRETPTHASGRYCPCPPCRAIGRQVARTHRARVKRGEQAWGDLEAVLAHIELLRQSGIGAHQIADLANIGHSTIARMIWQFAIGRTAKVTVEVANRILAVRYDVRKLAPRTIVDSTRARRLLQALVVAGWPVPLLAQRYGTDRQNFLKYFHRERYAASVCVRILDLFEECWREGPPNVSKQSATRARLLADKHGWVGIGAWDDDTIDDPNAEPNLRGDDESIVDPVSVKRVLDGHRKFRGLSFADRVELVRQWVELGRSKTAFEKRFAVSTKTSGKYFDQAVPDYQRKKA
jgi:hypothetical protein